ncbi:carboxypeptidase-like regulatory domain-containing protein [Nonlabens arenilitoris]|nr:carboxypeptidase-like regulatory domain-containing protein [Nonlabens arenilitoris]
MKNFIYIFLFLGMLTSAQVQRVQVKGTISSELNTDLSGITIFNNNSLEGTVTNDSGVFYIDVKKGDQLSFKAIQFESFSLNVSEKVVEEKKIELGLNPDVKDLETVNLSTTSFMIPVKRVETVDSGLEKVALENIKTAAVDRIDNTFSNRVRQPEEYEVRAEAFQQSQPRFNMIGLSTTINTANIARSLDVKNISKDDSVPVETNALVLLKNKYSKEYLLNYLDLEEKDFIEYGYFVQDNGLTKDLVQADNELDLLEFLSQQAVQFKKRKMSTDE